MHKLRLPSDAMCHFRLLLISGPSYTKIRIGNYTSPDRCPGEQLHIPDSRASATPGTNWIYRDFGRVRLSVFLQCFSIGDRRVRGCCCWDALCVHGDPARESCSGARSVTFFSTF